MGKSTNRYFLAQDLLKFDWNEASSYYSNTVSTVIDN
jgi:hypothetical protein